jgi:hypothetical protein
MSLAIPPNEYHANPKAENCRTEQGIERKNQNRETCHHNSDVNDPFSSSKL